MIQSFSQSPTSEHCFEGQPLSTRDFREDILYIQTTTNEQSKGLCAHRPYMIVAREKVDRINGQITQ
jgi:hypothetical protein